LADDINAWFKSYKSYLISYARLADELDVEMFSISCELNKMEQVEGTDPEANWVDLIHNVREVYPKGYLTASTNHDGAEFAYKHWGLLDYIGVDAYYNIFTPSNSVSSIQQKWQDTREKLKALSDQYNKPVIFTEIGYCKGKLSYKCDQGSSKRPLQEKNMANYYEAVFQTFGEDNWFHGVFWWNWVPDHSFGGDFDHCMSPQYKPAELVLRKNYGGPQEIPKMPEEPAVCKCVL